ncbi:hypothetical protein KC722_01560 [Candidatus Kaiserbacteria bacterium]|nr:hypothetical protein [Candidatus Kaiserbacteria bacterium]MCB9811426.1 hypothetical protein [Candidatus Nomurabacteria bacterium]
MPSIREKHRRTLDKRSQISWHRKGNPIQPLPIPAGRMVRIKSTGEETIVLSEHPGYGYTLENHPNEYFPREAIDPIGR